MPPTAIRIVTSFSELDDVLAGAIGLTGTMTMRAPTGPTEAQKTYLTSRPPLANLVSAGFNFGQATFGNAGGGDEGARLNEQWYWGYNAGSGTPYDKPGEHQLAWNFESFYNPSPGVKHSETYLTYTNRARTYSLRIFAADANLTTDVIDALFAADLFHFQDHNGVDRMTISPTSVRLIGPALTQETNDVAFGKQLNAAGSNYVEIARVNSNDVLHLGFGAADIKWGKAVVALGGGAAPTLGTIGGSGPSGAGQTEWLRVVTSTNQVRFIPLWA